MHLFLPVYLEAQLKAIAKQTNKTEQELIIEAITKHLQELNQSQNCYDLALQLGVIGRAENLPADLSTNPNYLE
ncbi:hypothetical protein H6G72_05875 [Planktothricoides sp. FACHB-1370]|uniref:CopG family transcriptional regulator n=1 Tax=Planktothricoides raciborskii FACHB-1370 TaxID=2949576 RepID=A0ABR8EB33_9CYAN|nr:hypothetical protein [Planktothricoides raciborskii FACHB-1370]MBD2581687.1 hypothetical protein [Planktothricoides raciborskii FACHB-1261]